MNKRLILLQLVLVLAGVIIAMLLYDKSAVLAALYGGGVALANTQLLVRRVAKAGRIAATNPQQSTYMLYFGAVQRFVFVLVALGVGMGVLMLVPPPMLWTFGLAQIAYFFSERDIFKQSGA